MTEPAVKYRLIKTEKHTGARLGEIITPLVHSQHQCLCRLGHLLLLNQCLRKD